MVCFTVHGVMNDPASLDSHVLERIGGFFLTKMFRWKAVVCGTIFTEQPCLSHCWDYCAHENV